MRQESDKERSDLLGLLRQRIRQPQHEAELRHLGGLDVNGSDDEPSFGAASRMAEAEDAHQKEERHHAENPVRERANAMIIDVARCPHHAEGGEREQSLALQVVLRIAKQRRGWRCARAIDHHDAEAEQGDHDRREDRIHGSDLGARGEPGLQSSELGAGGVVAHGVASVRSTGPRPRSSSTELTNTSPRCL